MASASSMERMRNFPTESVASDRLDDVDHHDVYRITRYAKQSADSSKPAKCGDSGGESVLSRFSNGGKV
jgi:hypothetical protein